MNKRLEVRRLDGNLHFEALSSSGNRVELDGSDDDKAMSPVELLLAAIGSCSAFDVALILEKQGRKIDEFFVEVEGKRREEGECKPFHGIHLIFNIRGDVDFAMAERVVQLAVTKYCSVGATLRPETEVTFEVKAC